MTYHNYVSTSLIVFENVYYASVVNNDFLEIWMMGSNPLNESVIQSQLLYLDKVYGGFEFLFNNVTNLTGPNNLVN